nr:hypothetical protein [Tanacetum cinerariifolium]
MAIAKILQRLVPQFASEILGLLHSFPVGIALSSKLMMWYLPSMQNLGKDVGTSFEFDLYAPRFFNEVQICHQLGFHPMSIGNGSYSSCDLKRSNITRVQLSPFAKTYHSLPKRYFQHDLISYLKLKRFSSYVGIALLMIKGSLDTALDLNYLLSCLVDDLWVSKLSVFNLIPTDRLLTLASIQCLKRSSLNAGMVTVVLRKFYQRQEMSRLSEMVNDYPNCVLPSRRLWLPIQLLQVLIHLIQPKMDGIL